MIEDFFDKNDDEYLRFDKVENKLSNRPDLCAFMLLDKLVPGERNIISAAGHDEFFIGVELDELEKVAKDEDLLTLIRCGCRIQEDALFMFA